MRTVLLAGLVGALLWACEPETAGSSSKSITPAPAKPTAEDCVAVRAGLFEYESQLRLLGAAAGSGGSENPFIQNKIDNYKLDHPKCFF